MTGPEPSLISGSWIPILAGIGSLTLLFARHRLLLAYDTPWMRALLAIPSIGALIGALSAWALPEELAGRTNAAIPLLLLFLAAWVGFEAGCGFDLRALRRTALGPLLTESVASAGAVGACFILAYTVSHLLPTTPAITPPMLLVLPAICIVGQPMARMTVRGARRGFWVPSAAAGLAVLLAAAGSGVAAGMGTAQSLPAWIGGSYIIDGALERTVWAVAAGCLIGLVADLSTKDDFVPEGLLLRTGAVLLIGAGLAGTVGLDILLVSAVAGFWLINATLRRLDILHVLDRAGLLPRWLTGPAVGWVVGHSGGGDGSVAVVTFIVIVALRPVVRLVPRRWAASTPRSRGHEVGVADLVPLDSLGLLLAAGLIGWLEVPAAAGVLLGVLVAQWVLGLSAAVWEVRHGTVGGGPAASGRARPADA